MADQTIQITKKMLADWFVSNNRSEREDRLWEFLRCEEKRKHQKEFLRVAQEIIEQGRYSSDGRKAIIDDSLICELEKLLP